MPVSEISLRNLTNSGSLPRYEEGKKRRQLTVTDEGWNATKAIAKKQFKLSVSEMLEKIGRGELILQKASESD
jgi:hypothetical protein